MVWCVNINYQAPRMSCWSSVSTAVFHLDFLRQRGHSTIWVTSLEGSSLCIRPFRVVVSHLMNFHGPFINHKAIYHRNPLVLGLVQSFRTNNATKILRLLLLFKVHMQTKVIKYDRIRICLDWNPRPKGRLEKCNWLCDAIDCSATIAR